MKLTHPLLLAVATASLALTSCSSEPSDWRPGEKVSVDLVEPGTRASDDFDHSVPSGSVENQQTDVAKAARAANSAPAPVPSAESAISANAEVGMRMRGRLNDAGKSGQADTAENGHQIQR